MDWFTNTVNSYNSFSLWKRSSHSKTIRFSRDQRELERNKEQFKQSKLSQTRPECQPRGITWGNWRGAFYINNRRALWVINYKLRSHKSRPFSRLRNQPNQFHIRFENQWPFSYAFLSPSPRDWPSLQNGRTSPSGRLHASQPSVSMTTS